MKLSCRAVTCLVCSDSHNTQGYLRTDHPDPDTWESDRGNGTSGGVMSPAAQMWAGSLLQGSDSRTCLVFRDRLLHRAALSPNEVMSHVHIK